MSAYVFGKPSSPGGSNEPFSYPPIADVTWENYYADFIAEGIEPELARKLSRAMIRRRTSEGLTLTDVQQELERWSNTHTHGSVVLKSLNILHCAGDTSHPGTGLLREALLGLGHSVTTVALSSLGSYSGENFDVLVIQRSIQNPFVYTGEEIADLIRDNWFSLGKAVALDFVRPSASSSNPTDVSSIGTALGVHGNIRGRSDSGVSHNITDSTHRVSQGLSGITPIYQQSSYQYSLETESYVGNKISEIANGSSDLNGKTAFVVVDTGTTLLDSTTSLSRIAVGEFFYASQGGESISGAPYTDAGLQLVQQTLQWLIGSGVVPGTDYGQDPSDGTSSQYALKDHGHGTPTNPVPAHEAATDPHDPYVIGQGVKSFTVALDAPTDPAPEIGDVWLKI